MVYLTGVNASSIACDAVPKMLDEEEGDGGVERQCRKGEGPRTEKGERDRRKDRVAPGEQPELEGDLASATLDTRGLRKGGGSERGDK
jgi:hypothetical protein